MSQLFILQLSDIHFNSTNNEAVAWDEQIATAMQGRLPVGAPLLIVVNGDIAFSGKRHEYALATNFINSVTSHITQIFKPQFICVYAVAGNHDVDMTLSSSGRNDLVKSNATLGNVAFSQILLEPQQAFRDFCESIEKNNPKPFREVRHEFFAQYEHTINDKSICITLLNSAIATQNPERAGTLIAPVPDLVEKDASDLVITVIHHPPHWLRPEERQKLINYLHKSSDAVLTGHEHHKSTYKTDYESSTLMSIEAGALYDGKVGGPSEFRLLGIDMDSKQLEIFSFTRNRSENRYDGNTLSKTQEFLRNSGRLSSVFLLRKSYIKDILESLGAPIVHPRKHDLVLSDIYQLPDLQDEGKFLKSAEDRVVSHKKIIDYILDKKNVLIAGGDRSGKSSLSKVIQKSLCDRTVICVRVCGSDFKSVKIDHVRQCILKAVADQFEDNKCEQFLQMSLELKAIVIDDFHHLPGGMKTRTELAEILRNFASVIVAVSGNSSDADSVSLAASDASVLHSYSRCVILPFGNRLREMLVKRWVSIGLTSESLEQDITDESVRQLTNSIDEIIGRNLVVPYPFEILAILQSNDRGGGSAQVGSLGRAYEAMITMSLLQHGVPANQLNTWFTYLSNLAFSLYDRDDPEFSDNEFESWHKNHESKYAINLSRLEFVSILSKSSILLLNDKSVAFKYRYVFCFFVAKYLSEKITDGNVLRIIEDLLSHIDHDDSAHVLSFLCFSTNDERIRTSLLKVAQSYFPNIEELSFGSDSVKYINQCATGVELVFSAGSSPDENRRKQLERKDRDSLPARSAQANDPMPAKLQRASGVGVPDDFSTKYRAAFRLVSIIGQTLRSHAGSLESDPKKELARAAFSLALRADAARISYAEADYSIFVKRIGQFLIDEKSDMSPDHAKIIARAIVYYFCVRGTASAMSAIAQSVTAKDLAVTLRDLAAEAANATHALISLAIGLEQPYGLVLNELISREKEFRDNRYATDVLRKIVAQHMYLFNIRQKKRQAVNDLLKIGSDTDRPFDQRAKRV